MERENKNLGIKEEKYIVTRLSYHLTQNLTLLMQI